MNEYVTDTHPLIWHLANDRRLVVDRFGRSSGIFPLTTVVIHETQVQLRQVDQSSLVRHLQHRLQHLFVFHKRLGRTAFHFEMGEVLRGGGRDGDLGHRSRAVPLLQLHINDQGLAAGFSPIGCFQRFPLLAAIQLVAGPPGLASQIDRDQFTNSFFIGFRDGALLSWWGDRT